MKKFIFIALTVFSLLSFAEASAQRLKFYYYPNTNVYYDVANRNYIYPNNGNWQTVRVLPTGIRVSNTPRYVVYHSTPQVWVGNPGHITKYKNRPRGHAYGHYKRKHYYKSNGVRHSNSRGHGNGNGRGKH